MNRGLSLIEIILTLSLMMLLSWQGLIYYNKFNRKQQVKQSALNLVSVLKRAQNNALIGDSPCTGTDSLSGYRVVYDSANQYHVVPVCNGVDDASSKTYTLNTATAFAALPASFMFNSLIGDITAATDVTITIHHTGDASLTRTVIVYKGGEVTCTDCD